MTVDPIESSTSGAPRVSRRGLAVGCLVLAMLGMLGVGVATALLLSMLERDVSQLEAESAERGRGLLVEQAELTRDSLEALHPFSPPASGLVSEVGHRRVLSALREAIRIAPPPGSDPLAQRVALSEALAQHEVPLSAFVWSLDTLRDALSRVDAGGDVVAHENHGIARRSEALLTSVEAAYVLDVARVWLTSSEAASP